MTSEHKPHDERPLHDYIDMEAYDVVSGEHHRALEEQAQSVRQAAEWEREHGGCDCRTCQEALGD